MVFFAGELQLISKNILCTLVIKMILEFTVSGPPVSHQSHNKHNLRAWRDKVRAAAAAQWGTRDILDICLRLAVVYYHRGTSVRNRH